MISMRGCFIRYGVRAYSVDQRLVDGIERKHRQLRQ